MNYANAIKVEKRLFDKSLRSALVELSEADASDLPETQAEMFAALLEVMGTTDTHKIADAISLLGGHLHRRDIVPYVETLLASHQASLENAEVQG